MFLPTTAATTTRPRRTRSQGLPRVLPALPLLALAFIHVGCAARREQPPVAPTVAPTPAAGREPDVKEVRAFEILGGDEELTYNGYRVRKLHGREKIEGQLWEGSYVVIERAGKVLMKLDAGLYTPMGNAVSFGLYPLLGGEAKQLIVSQDIFRGGQQWIVSLSERPRAIYDGAEFGAGREGADMGIVDLDGDGVYEITQPLTAFYGFESLPPGWTPLPIVIFKYDGGARKYLPANALFQDYLLGDVEDAKARISGPDDRLRHLADVLRVVLSYVFAGREPEGWVFYEEAYRLPDKADMKRKIKAELGDIPVYRFMNRRAAKVKT
jgi:hypothetical protein